MQTLDLRLLDDEMQAHYVDRRLREAHKPTDPISSDQTMRAEGSGIVPFGGGGGGGGLTGVLRTNWS